MDVRVCARGTLTNDTRTELAGFTENSDGAMVELRGSVVDQPDLIGLLERLRRAGLHITDVETLPGTGTTASDAPARVATAVARFEFRGRVAELLHLVLADAQLSEEAARTILEVPLPDDGEGFFDVLARLEELALEICEVHVHGLRRSGGAERG